MIALIGCEESQSVCIALRMQGIEAYSCDIKPCSGGHPEWHIQGDVIDAINTMDVDFIGLHPVCTRLTVSENRTYGIGKAKYNERVEAIEWTVSLWNLACSKAKMVYMENPIGVLNSDRRLPKPQIIQPYYFGDPTSKATCLWLKNLPFLQYSVTDNLFGNKTSVEPIWQIYNSSKTKSGKSRYSFLGKLSTSRNNEESRRIRSKTFPGIANAIATQWGSVITNNNKPFDTVNVC